MMNFSNPVYELSNHPGGLDVASEITAEANINEIPNVAFKVEHVLTPQNCPRGKLGSFKRESCSLQVKYGMTILFFCVADGLQSRWKVAHAIYPYMACIAIAYCVTLSLYPGIESEIISCRLGSWMPVLLMFTFNTTDVIGKFLAAVPYSWSRRQLILMSGLRTLLVPLLLLCCAPRSQPIISGETTAFIFTAALGLSNGLAGSLPMMLAPAKVPATLKEVTGNMMTLSYNVGLTAGSLVGYVFDSMLGPQQTNPCPVYPFVPKPPTIITTLRPLVLTTTTTARSLSTTIEQFLTSTSASTNITTLATTAAPSIVTDDSDLFSSMASMILSNTTHFLSNITYDSI
jgi:solute carrier family 29 (equilibrative nucleoside transporter), member 4